MKRVALIALILLSLVTSPAAAGVTVVHRPGGWSDVVRGPDGFLFVRATSSEVVTERPDGTLRWQVRIPEPILYLRAAVDDAGTVQAVGQGNHSGTAYVIAAAGVMALGPSFGQNATAIAWSSSRGFAYYVQTSASTYAVYRDAGGGCDPCVVVMPATSQGFRDIQPDGQVRRGDDYMTASFLGRQFWAYVQRGDLTVGQCDPPGICAVADGRVFTLVTGNAFEPHLAVDGATFAVATRTEFGATLAIVSPPYPPADTAPGPDPAPTPTPPAPPTPVPPSAPRADMPNRIAELRALRAEYPGMLNQVQAGELLGRLAFRLKAEGFGLLRKDGGNNCPVRGLDVRVACDWILHAPTQTGCDVLGDGPAPDVTGASTPSWCAGEPADFSRFVAVTIDPGSSMGPVIVLPPVVNPPAGGVTRTDLDLAIAAVRAEFAAAARDQQQALSAAEARLNGRIDGVHVIDLPGLRDAIDAALANYQICGMSEKDRLGLQHRVCLGLTRKK